jgi:hypothetical protein
VQQDHAYAGRIGLAVEPFDERAARTTAALARGDEHEHQVGGGRLPDERRDPAGGLGTLRRQQRDGLAVALGQPGPRAGPGDQAGGLPLERAERLRPFGRHAEACVPADDLQAEPGHDADVVRPGSPNPQPWITISYPERVRASPHSPRNCPGGEDLKRGQPVTQQRGNAVHVPAGPVDHRRGVRIAGARHVGQVLAPPSEQPVKAVRYVGTGNLGRQPEPAGGSPGQVQALRRARPVLAAPGRRRPPAGPAQDERRAAGRRRLPGHDGRQ